MTHSDGTGSTREVWIGAGAISQVAPAYARCFGEKTPIIIADENTWHAVGSRVEALLSASRPTAKPFILSGDPPLYAEMTHVDAIYRVIAQQDVIPVAVGAGTINDLVKLAAHRCGRGYMIVGTAASMDGYTAFGASITFEGSKQTFDCPAPRVFIADTDVVARAPADMAPTGYADLMAKAPAGADWILADALGIEPIVPAAWELVQKSLYVWLGQPSQVRRADPPALEQLMQGLVSSGLGMQATQSSRPASGAEHQFSHLWDMQVHRHHGKSVPHGAKVAIGTLASAAMYDVMLEMPIEKIDIDDCCARWPTFETIEQRLTQLHDIPAIRDKAILESRVKYVPAASLHDRLVRLVTVWRSLRPKLRQQLPAATELRRMLGEAGAPTHPTEIGISLDRLRTSYALAHSIRRRYTILDLAMETGTFDSVLDRLFGTGGFWAR